MKKIISLATALTALFVTGTAKADTEDHRIYYLRSNVIPPWDVTSNEVDMDDVFGSGAWRNRQYETADLSRLFSPSTQMIFMEGGDNNANALKSFLDANRIELTTWV